MASIVLTLVSVGYSNQDFGVSRYSSLQKPDTQIKWWTVNVVHSIIGRASSIIWNMVAGHYEDTAQRDFSDTNSLETVKLSKKKKRI